MQSTHHSSLSTFNQSSLAAFQSETRSYWLALLALTGHKQELPVQYLNAPGSCLYLSTDFTKGGTFSFFYLFSLCHFSLGSRSLSSPEERQNAANDTCLLIAVLSLYGLESLLHSSRTQGLCRKGDAVHLCSGHLILRIVSNGN